MKAFFYFSKTKNQSFMKNIVCLNCNEAVERNYCSNCGQKTDIHRITLKHFLFHDVIHGVWHLDRGILFTIKQALLRPGKAALDYIGGKRIRYYNVFYLILLLIGLGLFIDAIYVDSLEKYVTFGELDTLDEIEKETIKIYSEYLKFFIILAIPAYAFNSYILFNKKKLFYSEHLIVFGMLFLGIIIITLFGNILLFADFLESIYFLSDWSKFIVPILLLPYVINGLYGAFGKEYTKISFAFRTLLYIILFMAEFKFVAIAVKFYLRHYN